ncbi:MAG TPA: hypothetical protein VFR67_25745 [Pilimelia sp.]|nr:hypothetical protein [Pilimelia sp.]
MASGVVDALLNSAEPSVRWKVRTRVLGESPRSPRNRALREEIRNSPRVGLLLAGRGPDGRLEPRHSVYGKWFGAHWVLAALADLGYPPGDPALVPLRDQVVDHWLRPHFFVDVELADKAATYRHEGVPVMRGRHRRCGSQQGNALRSVAALGLLDDRAGRLVERLLHWQWPDGGWNCDREPAASVSSFCETLLPMRGLAAYADATGDGAARRAAERATEVFLSRRLLYRRGNGQLIHPEFTRLHYPLYWHYDVLGGLVGLAEAGAITDERCADALDLLESRRLPDGGWPLQRRYYRTSPAGGTGTDLVDWSGAGPRRMNEWVTADALAVLAAAGRTTG